MTSQAAADELTSQAAAQEVTRQDAAQEVTRRWDAALESRSRQTAAADPQAGQVAAFRTMEWLTDEKVEDARQGAAGEE